MSENTHRAPEELDAYLAARQRGEHPAPSPALTADETRLADELTHLAARTVPDPGFASALQERLHRTATSVPSARASRGPHMVNRSVFALGAALALALILASVVIGAQLLTVRGTPTSVAMATLAATPTLASPSPSVAAPTAAFTPPSSPSEPPALPPLEEAAGVAYGGGGGFVPFTQMNFVLDRALPEGPVAMVAYFQGFAPPLTLGLVRQVAGQWGVRGPIYIPMWMADVAPDSTQPRSYVVIDGPRRLWFEDSEAVDYTDTNLFPAHGGHHYPTPNLPPVDQAVAAASRFLESRGLLDAMFRVDTSSYAYATIHYYVTGEGGWPLHAPFASVRVDEQGRVGSAWVRDFRLETIGEYPIITAQEAWELLSSGQAEDRILFRRISPSFDGNPKYWARASSVSQRVHLFGSLGVLLPAEGTSEAYVWMNHFVLSGDVSGLVARAKASQGPVHVWGTVQDAGGYLALEVAGWEPFDETGMAWSGTVVRQGDQASLKLEDGRMLALPDLPADVPDGEPLYVDGGLVDGVLEWSILQEHPIDKGSMPPDLSQAEAIVDKVEPAYVVPQVDALPPASEADPAHRMLQPCWRFSGHIGADTLFEAYVQAVR